MTSKNSIYGKGLQVGCYINNIVFTGVIRQRKQRTEAQLYFQKESAHLKEELEQKEGHMEVIQTLASELAEKVEKGKIIWFVISYSWQDMKERE